MRNEIQKLVEGELLLTQQLHGGSSTRVRLLLREDVQRKIVLKRRQRDKQIERIENKKRDAV
jgi:hypothetical protein